MPLALEWGVPRIPDPSTVAQISWRLREILSSQPLLSITHMAPLPMQSSQ